MEPVHIPELSVAGAKTTEMTEPYSACSQLGLAEGMSGSSCFRPQTAVRILSRKWKDRAVGLQREPTVPVNICLVIRLFHQPSCYWASVAWAVLGTARGLWGRWAFRWA